jgi:phosphatidylglycerophosphate synthase
MPQRFTLAEVRARTYKDRDAWWTVWLVDPLAARLVRLVAPYPAVTPNRVTGAAFVIGLASAAAFAGQSPPWLVAGAILFHLSFVLDCMDGKIARLNGTGSIFGVWLDFVLDRVKVLICAIALFGGQFAHGGDLAYLWAGGAVIFLDMFRYVNSAQLGKVRAAMRLEIAMARGEQGRVSFIEETVTQHPMAAVITGGGAVVDVYSDFRVRFGLFVRLRNALVRQRVRAHLVSGIEFEMAVFIVGPLTGLVVGAPVVAGSLLVLFELLLIYKLFTATRSYGRHLPAIGAWRIDA